MNRVAHIVWQSVGIAVTVALLVLACVWGYIARPSAASCHAIVYILRDGDRRQYVTPDELDALLQQAHLHPVGYPMELLSLQQIENAIRHHDMVRTAECYRTPWNEVRVAITQRVPLLRVQTAAETFLIDTDRRVMPVRVSVTDTVLLVTGAVGPQLASTQLADFAEWLLHNPYWREQIDHVHMRNPQLAVLCLRDKSQPQIILGELSGYEQRLRKLRTFQQGSADVLQDKHYRELDLRFHGQVIGR